MSLRPPPPQLWSEQLFEKLFTVFFEVNTKSAAILYGAMQGWCEGSSNKTILGTF